MAEPSIDLLQVAKALVLPFGGAVVGMLARWSAEAKAGRVKSLRRMALLDLPTLGALTLVAGQVAQKLDADPLTAASIGCAVGYIGTEAVNLFAAWSMRSVQNTAKAQPK